MPPARQMPHCTATQGNPGVDKKGNAFFTQIVAAGEQCRRHARGCIEQIVIGKGVAGIDDSSAFAMPLGTGN